MRYHVYVFRVIFLCLCIFGSTKSFTAFDFSNSTVIEAEKEDKQPVRFSEGQTIELANPLPQTGNDAAVPHKERRLHRDKLVGVASWYGGEFHGQKTASGEVFDENAYTLAHLTLPMGTEVLVTNSETNISVRARVNDRGPYVKGRIADLSYGLAKQVGIVRPGTGTVILTVL